MKHPILIPLIISVALNVLFYLGYEKEKDQNVILLFENINLRGYKSAYMEHITSCDSTGNYLMKQLTKE